MAEGRHETSVQELRVRVDVMRDANLLEPDELAKLSRCVRRETGISAVRLGPYWLLKWETTQVCELDILKWHVFLHFGLHTITSSTSIQKDFTALWNGNFSRLKF